jgi:UDP-N-acetylmuramoyl-L-alanyl-D-glutamate--2,6-diaminopimelate ligase
MLFCDLISELPRLGVTGRPDVEISSIVYDSRRATAGSLFVAVRGEASDGHGFAAAAVRNGAVAVVAEQEMADIPLDKVGLVVVEDSRAAMAGIAARFYNYPSRRVNLIGVTGTKGKTTTTYLISSVLRAAGQKTGVIGTIGSRIVDQVIHSEHTTPESIDLQALLARMVEAGVQSVAMEVSSHGLAQQRVGGCEFDCGIFTNLTRDHLDYHSTMEEYLDAKLLLFRDHGAVSTKQFTSIVNVDDPVSSSVVKAAAGRLLTFSVKSPADITASDIRTSATGVSYTLGFGQERAGVSLKLGGLFNVYNSLAAAGAAISQGLSIAQIAQGLSAAETVPGRFEPVECGQDFAVVVDYAHAPDALENVLKAARELTDGRIIVVFGCGGDRDRGKRPMMGRIAADFADRCIVTSDNPRTENPTAIIEEILTGIDSGGRGRIDVEVDRREAITAALRMAEPGDLVLVAGKGHEDYQIFADKTIHFDDREVVREILCASS